MIELGLLGLLVFVLVYSITLYDAARKSPRRFPMTRTTAGRDKGQGQCSSAGSRRGLG